MNRLGRFLLVALMVAITTRCTIQGDRPQPADTSAQRSRDAPRPTVPRAADTELVRGQGLPADADDTAHTRYGKHETPRRIASPSCRPNGIALCLVDTARTLYSVDCCMADSRQTHWLVFAAAQDSFQLFLDPSQDAYLTMQPRNAAGAGAETSLGVDASWLRARFPVSGTYVFTTSIETEMEKPYELRVASVLATGASQPTGYGATLTVAGPRNSWIAIAPRAMMPQGDSATLRRFAVRPGRYRVLLVRDTAYVACRLPCVSRESFTLKPGQSATTSP